VNLKKQPEQKSDLDKAIDRLFDDLQTHDPETDKYAAIVTQLEKLYTLRCNSKPATVSKDTLYIVGGNIVVALIIVSFEKTHVITTKMISFLLKLR
jgi:hypothetical protein